MVRPSGASAGGSALFKRACKRSCSSTVILMRPTEEGSIVSMEAILICVGTCESDVETQACIVLNAPTKFEMLQSTSKSGIIDTNTSFWIPLNSNGSSTCPVTWS